MDESTTNAASRECSLPLARIRVLVTRSIPRAMSTLTPPNPDVETKS